MVPALPAQANHKPSATDSFPIANAIASAIPRLGILKLHYYKPEAPASE